MSESKVTKKPPSDKRLRTKTFMSLPCRSLSNGKVKASFHSNSGPSHYRNVTTRKLYPLPTVKWDKPISL